MGGRDGEIKKKNTQLKGQHTTCVVKAHAIVTEYSGCFTSGRAAVAFHTSGSPTSAGVLAWGQDLVGTRIACFSFYTGSK